MAGYIFSARGEGDGGSSPLRKPREAAPDVAGQSRAFEKLAADYGFSFYLVARFPHGDKSDFLSNHVLSNWPEDLRRRYAAADVFRCSSLVARLKETILPVFSNCCVFSKGEANQNANGLTAVFSQAGLRDTLSFSAHDMRLRHHIIAFSGVKPTITEQEKMELFFRALALLENHVRQETVLDGPRERLTGREIECLRWSAAGKSSEEIAIILEISSHTVASYLKAAMRKLDSVNRMQAIARACRYRLL